MEKLKRSFEVIFDRWEDLPVLVRSLSFPLTVAIWIPYICIFLPAALISIALDRCKPPAKMSREELAEWADRLTRRFAHIRRELNPDEDGFFDPPHERTKVLATLLNDPSRSKTDLDRAAKETIADFADWKIVHSIAELVWFAKHIETWAADE